MQGIKNRNLGMDHYFKWKQRKQIRPHLISSLLAPYWDTLAASMFDRGYHWYSVHRTIGIAKSFAEYAEAQGILDTSELTDELVEQYLKTRIRRYSRSCICRLMTFLRERGALRIAPLASPDPLSPAILEEYLQFLRDHRGICAPQVKRHRLHVLTFLGSLGATDTSAIVERLDASAICRFIVKRADRLTRSQRKVMCAAVRMFLRFLHFRGYMSRDLSSSVPVIPSFRLDRVPHVIDADDIKKIIEAVDRSTPMGRRDYALLLVLATYGIRSSQICAIRLDDIDWRRETILIRGAKRGRDVVLPLCAPVGEALVDYLRHDRPQCLFREVFLRVLAPIGPLCGSLNNIIRPYARKAGVTSRAHPHAWRHGCATRMLAKGQQLKTIKDILGHRSIEATFIYTKVDIEMLRQAALDWPEVAR